MVTEMRHKIYDNEYLCKSLSMSRAITHHADTRALCTALKNRVYGPETGSAGLRRKTRHTSSLTQAYSMPPPFSRSGRMPIDAFKMQRLLRCPAWEIFTELQKFISTSCHYSSIAGLACTNRCLTVEILCSCYSFFSCNLEKNTFVTCTTDEIFRWQTPTSRASNPTVNASNFRQPITDSYTLRRKVRLEK